MSNDYLFSKNTIFIVRKRVGEPITWRNGDGTANKKFFYVLRVKLGKLLVILRGRRVKTTLNFALSSSSVRGNSNNQRRT